jgi:hypothetical protein
VPRVATVIDDIFRCRVAGADFDELGLIGVIFAEVGAEAALTVVNFKHDELLAREDSWEIIGARGGGFYREIREGEMRMSRNFGSSLLMGWRSLSNHWESQSAVVISRG